MKNLTCYSFLLLTLIPGFLSPFSFSQSIDLSGEWRFQLDPEDRGESEKWFERKLAEILSLPGCLQAQGFGDEVTIDTSWTGDIIDQSWFTDPRYEKYRQTGNVKVPFWLQPDRHYKGAAWYQKTVTIPDSWKAKRITLKLERPHWKTSVWIDSHWIGSQDSLSTPHVFDLGHFLDPGEHQITIRVDNRMIVDVGKNAHSVTDHTQSNWNGIVGDIELFATNSIWIMDLQIFPDAGVRSIKVKYEIGNQTTSAIDGVIRFKVWSASGSTTEISEDFGFGDGSGSGNVNIRIGNDAPLWDEFNPELHHLSALIETTSSSGRQVVRDKQELAFGLREIGTDGTQFLINGRKTFLRGTLECSIFPLTGYPPAAVNEWRRIIQQAQAFGLNHMRFHSWCPPKAAFIAADQLGFYFQVECGAWAKIGDGEPIDQWIYAEGDRILKEYGNHPSFLFLAYGNEPGGDHQKEWLGKLNSSNHPALREFPTEYHSNWQW